MMNKSMSARSEEARREAHAATLKARQAQNDAVRERAQLLAVKAEKIENLRALRLASEAAAKEEAAIPKPAAPRKRKAKQNAAVVEQGVQGDTAAADAGRV